MFSLYTFAHVRTYFIRVRSLYDQSPERFTLVKPGNRSYLMHSILDNR